MNEGMNEYETVYYTGSKMKKNEIGLACGTYDDLESCFKFLAGNPQ
jgi:hypothetical protein